MPALEPLLQSVDANQFPASDAAEALANGYSSAGNDVLMAVSGGANCSTNNSRNSSAGFSMIENYVPGGGTQSIKTPELIGKLSDGPLGAAFRICGTPPTRYEAPRPSSGIEPTGVRGYVKPQEYRCPSADRRSERRGWRLRGRSNASAQGFHRWSR